MAVKIDREFTVQRPPEEVWAFLIDPARVAACLPGAHLDEQVDERTYRGRFGLELGPMDLTFKGTVRFDRMDEEAREVEMSASGNTKGGVGSAKMSMGSRLRETGDGATIVSVRQSVVLQGRIGAFGRGGIVKRVADTMFDRFTRCVRRKLEAS